jgi:hypothetical protein
MMLLVLESETVTKEPQPLRVGKIGTGDKDELMDFKGSLGWRSKGKDKQIDGTDEGTGATRHKNTTRGTLWCWTNYSLFEAIDVIYDQCFDFTIRMLKTLHRASCVSAWFELVRCGEVSFSPWAAETVRLGWWLGDPFSKVYVGFTALAVPPTATDIPPNASAGRWSLSMDTITFPC